LNITNEQFFEANFDWLIISPAAFLPVNLPVITAAFLNFKMIGGFAPKKDAETGRRGDCFSPSPRLPVSASVFALA